MTVTPLGESLVLPAFDSSTLPPRSDAAMSTMTEPGFIRPTASAVTSSGGLRPGACAGAMTMSIPPLTAACPARSAWRAPRQLRGRDDHVRPPDGLVELGLLRCALPGPGLACVAAGAGR